VVLRPFAGGWQTRRVLLTSAALDRALPVATVSRVGDIVALARARTAQDGHGEPFVLGAAMLDLGNPAIEPLECASRPPNR
jgi:hypothetical protein